MSDLPATFKQQELMDALGLLGIPSADTRQVTIYPSRIIVEQLRRDENGLPIVAGNELATIKTVIGLEKE